MFLQSMHSNLTLPGEADKQITPWWHSYNQSIQLGNDRPPDNIGDLPVIQESPSEFNIVYTVLRKAVNSCRFARFQYARIQ